MNEPNPRARQNLSRSSRLFNYRLCRTQINRTVLFLLTLCLLGHGSIAALGKPLASKKDLAAQAVDEYRKKSTAFFATAPDQPSKINFYRSWRERLVTAVNASENPASRVAALGEAIAIDNSLGDYVDSIALIEKLLKLNRPADTSSYWSIQLGEVARLEWESSKNNDYGRLAVATFRRLLEDDVTIDTNTRLLVTGWLASIANPAAIMTQEDFDVTTAHVEAALQILDQGHVPGGRLAGTGFDQSWFLGYVLRREMQCEAFQKAFESLGKYDALADKPLSAAGVVVSIENSNRALVLDTDEAVEAYVAFLDKSADFLSRDPYAVTLRLIAARRYYQRGNYDAAGPRLEALLTSYKPAIAASMYADYYFADIFRMLRDVYHKNGLPQKAKEAAEQALEFKQRINARR